MPAYCIEYETRSFRPDLHVRSADPSLTWQYFLHYSPLFPSQVPQFRHQEGGDRHLPLAQPDRGARGRLCPEGRSHHLGRGGRKWWLSPKTGGRADSHHLGCWGRGEEKLTSQAILSCWFEAAVLWQSAWHTRELVQLLLGPWTVGINLHLNDCWLQWLPEKISSKNLWLWWRKDEQLGPVVSVNYWVL